MTGLTNKRDEWAHECADDNPSDKTTSFESNVHLSAKKDGAWVKGAERTLPETRRVANVWSRAAAVNGRFRRSYGQLSAAFLLAARRYIRQGNCKANCSSAAPSAALKGDETTGEGNWRGALLLHAY